MNRLTVDEYVDALESGGELLRNAAVRVDLDTAIPTCPGWQMRDLLRHTGQVHRWASRYIAEGLQDMVPTMSEAEQLGSGPPDAELVDWFSAGHRELVKTLRAADPDVQAWTFLDAPSPLTFWARRQAHETAIHRADAELASGSVTPYAPHFAVDGIEELLFGFAERSARRLRADRRRVFAIHLSDAGDTYLITMGPDGGSASREKGDADCVVNGRASDLYLMLWNRRGLAGLATAGDPAVIDAWRGQVQVRWG